jgi:putative transposase
MIDPTHRLPLLRQAQLLDLSRSSLYHQPQPTPESDLKLMRRMDELHLELPFAGSRCFAICSIAKVTRSAAGTWGR